MRAKCGVAGLDRFVAMRDVVADEELTVGYAIFDDDPYEMRCHCGSNRCRGLITGVGWGQSKIQKRYDGYFSWS